MHGKHRSIIVISTMLAALALASPAAASSEAVDVEGRQAVSTGGQCPEGSFVMSGDLDGCWTTDSFRLVAANPSGVVVGSGTETFVGCIGSRCGTLSFSFVFVGRFDAAGAEVRGGCHHPVKGGTGDFAGARGELNFVDDPDGSWLPPADYSGHVVFRD